MYIGCTLQFISILLSTQNSDHLHKIGIKLKKMNQIVFPTKGGNHTGLNIYSHLDLELASEGKYTGAINLAPAANACIQGLSTLNSKFLYKMHIDMYFVRMESFILKIISMSSISLSNYSRPICGSVEHRDTMRKDKLTIV
jgi:hypothetical protein